MNFYQIIYLNGPSSVGKSTIARHLQDKLSKPYLVLGIDQLIFMMPEKINNWHAEENVEGFSWESINDKETGGQLYKIHCGPFAKKIVQGLKDIVMTLARSGYCIIIDDVSIGKEEVGIWKEYLSSFRVLWVGLKAPYEILEEREKNRGDRKIGSSVWQAKYVHIDVEYDLMFDTYVSSNEEIVNKIIQKSTGF